MYPRTIRRFGALAGVLALVAACSSAGPPATSRPPASSAPAATTAATSTAPSGFTPVYVDGKLQPLPDGFPNQTITFLVVDEAGSDDDIYSRAFQDAMTPLSPVRVNVIDRPDLGANFGTWEALKYVAEQPGGKDGYLMTVASVTGTTLDLLQTPVAKELGASIDNENWVAVTEQVPWLMFSRTGAPWGSDVTKMVEYAKANPGQVKQITRGPGSAVSLAFEDYKNRFGITFKEIIGGSIEDVNIAVGAGEGDVAMNVTGSTVPFIQDKRVVALSCTGNQNPCQGLEGNIPNAASLLGSQGSDPWGSSRGVLLPPEVDPLHKAWLQELFFKATDNDAFKAGRAKLPGLTIVNYDSAKAKELATTIYNVGYDLLTKLGGLDPSVPPKP